MTSSAILMLLAVVVFAPGMLTLAWSPRRHETHAGAISRSHYPQAVAFIAIWTAVIVGIIERGLIALPIISISGGIIGYLASLTMPRKATVVSYALSIFGVGRCVTLAFA